MMGRDNVGRETGLGVEGGTSRTRGGEGRGEGRGTGLGVTSRTQGGEGRGNGRGTWLGGERGTSLIR